MFTNADSVNLYKNGSFVTRLTGERWHELHHSHQVIDDTVSTLLETQEGFDKKKAELLRDCLLAVRKYGLAGLPPAEAAKMGYAMVKYGMKYADAVKLYEKYVGNWGGEATVWRLMAVKDGEVAASCTLGPSARLHLEATPSSVRLTEGDTYDMAAVRIRILDENGNPAPYAQLPVHFRLTGDAQLVGHEVVTAEGGMTGAYLRTVGRAGQAKLTISTDQTEDVEILFQIHKK